VNKEKNTIIIVQARMGSTRLPGKSLMKFYKDYTIIDFVLLRCMKSILASKVILATSENSDCDLLVERAEELGCEVVRGDENDVLSRFITAIEIYNPDNIVRVCADNPFISWEEVDKLIFFFNNNNFDYASNSNIEICGLPDGFGAEIVAADILNKFYNKCSNSQKEHVTKYILENSDKFKIGYLKADNELLFPRIKLDIDTVEDFHKIQDLYKNKTLNLSCREIIDIYLQTHHE
jgi:spore coat polysaccharide biosynthesis protein SpsF